MYCSLYLQMAHLYDLFFTFSDTFCHGSELTSEPFCCIPNVIHVKKGYNYIFTLIEGGGDCL
jgi:hypothetical protein